MALPNNVTLPNNITNNTTSDATLVMANFNALADALNEPWTPDKGYDDLDYTYTYDAVGQVTGVVGTRSSVQVYAATITWTNGLPATVAETIGPSGSQVTKTTTISYTNGVPTSTTVA